MAEQKRKPQAGSPRTEVFALRLDPRLKYLAELAARNQRRSLAGFIESAIAVALDTTYLKYDPFQDSAGNTSILDQSAELWDVREADRLANLAFVAPGLMTYEDQIRWKVICETGYLWRGRHDLQGDWCWRVRERSLIRERLREHWDAVKRVAANEETRDVLPKTTKGPTGDLESELPFPESE